MTFNMKYNYLDPTYSAYYWYFNRPKTLLCFSLRQFIRIITIYDIIFSSIAVSFSLIYIIIDQLNRINIFQSNKFLIKLLHLPIGIFFDNRIIFQSLWTIDNISKNSSIFLYLHIILNSITLICSINMLIAIKYYKPYQALLYLVTKIAYFIHTTAIFIQWIVNNDKEMTSMQIFYNQSSFPYLLADMNIFYLALLEFIWKIFLIIMIFRSIQYIRDYCFHQQLNSIKNLSNKNPSSTLLMIHVNSNNNFLDK